MNRNLGVRACNNAKRLAVWVLAARECPIMTEPRRSSEGSTNNFCDMACGRPRRSDNTMFRGPHFASAFPSTHCVVVGKPLPAPGVCVGARTGGACSQALRLDGP